MTGLGDGARVGLAAARRGLRALPFGSGFEPLVNALFRDTSRGELPNSGHHFASNPDAGFSPQGFIGGLLYQRSCGTNPRRPAEVTQKAAHTNA